MASRSTNTMAEGLQKLVQEVTGLKMTPDADLEFLIGLETIILKKLREPIDAATASQPPPPGNAVTMGGASGGMGLPAMAGVGAGGPPMGQPGPGGGIPPLPGARFSPDALRSAMSPGVQGG